MKSNGLIKNRDYFKLKKWGEQKTCPIFVEHSGIYFGSYLIDDDVMFIKRNFSGVLEVVILKLWPGQSRCRLYSVLDGLARLFIVFSVLGQVVQPQRAFVVTASNQPLA